MAEWTWHEFLEWLDGCCCRQELPPGSCAEGIVVAAHAGAVTVRLDTGQAVRAVLAPGSYPRPGARVRVCFDGVHHVDQRTLHQPRRPSFTPDDAPDVTPTPSWDSPQRLHWLDNHLPGVDAQGEFAGGAGSALPLDSTVVLDSGLLRSTYAPRVDHDARQYSAVGAGETTISDPRTPGFTRCPPLGFALLRDEADRLTDYDFRAYDDYPMRLIHLQHIGDGGEILQVDVVTTRYADGAEDHVPLGSTRRPWSGYQAELVRVLEDGSTRAPLGRRWYEAWTPFRDGAVLYFGRTRYLQVRDPLRDWIIVWQDGTLAQPVSDWGDEAPPLDGDNVVIRVVDGDGSDGPLQEILIGESTAQPERPPGVRFLALGGQIQVSGPDRPYLSDLTGGTLTAWGQTIGGGSWTALRDRPAWDEQAQAWDFSRVIVLHDGADTIHVLREGRPAEAVPREVFEREILRTSPGTFEAFSPVGLMFHLWPPERALALCTRDTREVIAWDPWRDAIKARPAPTRVPPPGPDSWYWPGRPGRRPAALPASAPRPPGGVTLADVRGAVTSAPLLARGEPPARLPSTLEIWDAPQQAWQSADPALLAKRFLAPEVGWPEELDDRTGTPGRVRVTVST